MSRLKLTPEVLSTIIEGVRLGMTYADAAKAAGIGRSTFYNWKLKGERGRRGLYKDLLDKLKAAEMEGMKANLQTIHNASKDSWQAAAWLLERRFPQQWAKTVRNEISGIEGKPIKITLVEVVKDYGDDGDDGNSGTDN